MLKTRVQLSAIAILLGYLGYLLLVGLTSKVPGWKMVLMFLDVTFLTTALGILGCTFIRAKQLPSGSVCFMPNHPLVKLGFVNQEGTNLCPTFWSIGVLITTIGYVVFIMLGFLIYAVTQAINGNFFQEVGLPALVYIGCAGVLVLVLWLAKQDLWVWKVPIIVLTATLAILFLYLVPMVGIVESYNITLNSGEDWVVGTMIYLKWSSAILGSLVIAVTAIYLLFRHWGALSSSWLGKQIALLKEKLCVRFVECPRN